jgi:hypothetical protein
MNDKKTVITNLATLVAKNETPTGPEVDKTKARRAPIVNFTYPTGTIVPVAPSKTQGSVGCMIPVQVEGEVIISDDDGNLYTGKFKLSQGWASLDAASVRKYVAP